MISMHVMIQIRDIMAKHFGSPPWEKKLALAAEEFSEVLQATTDVAEHHEARANDLARVAMEMKVFIKQLDEQAEDYNTEWVREQIRNKGFLGQP